MRIIESTQAADGAIIYELFLEGRPKEPSYEIRTVEGGEPELLKERWKH